jgi:putative phosphoesterase
MIVGMISDTHDNLPMIDKAVERLNKEKVELVLHAGDYVSAFVLPRFKALDCKLIGVFGNNDGDHEYLRKAASIVKSTEIRGDFVRLELDGMNIALLHGKEDDLLKSLVESEFFDVVVYGHTHHHEIIKKGNTLLVNPGEVSGYLTGKPTIALLDTRKREAKLIEL